ncbi:hypothetical protein [uncultured Winogradskyella sp.]|uniref:hypothetical protein n=1 Tax=uncultured Winogradskyella sp. TaxID=395353 RepID=UPI00260457E3|nr:hypothetical protein [uncultured Winogradskyella sp.]
MKITKIILLIAVALTLTNCASRYRMIAPQNINYISTNENSGVKLVYKYDLLEKKYKKKELKKGVKLVAVRLTNNSGKDVMFGRDAKLVYENASEVYVMENEKAFKTLKQSPASYLWYLLLTPLNFYTTETNSNGFQQETSSTPIGLVLGPGLAGGNMIAAGSANKKFKEEMIRYKLYGTIIKNG